MQIALLGATGGTGQHVLQQALAAGHGVTAIGRDPGRLPTHARLRAVRADLTQPAELRPLLEGCRAVISVLGPRPGHAATPICTLAIRSVLAAVPADGPDRLLVVSAGGLGTDGDDPFTRVVVGPLLNRFLRDVYDDLRQMEREVQASSWNWVIVRPPYLTRGPHTGRYRIRRDLNVRGGLRLSRADLADCLLKLLPDPTMTRTIISVAS